MTTSKLANAAVTQDKIADGAVGASKLQPGIPINMQDAVLSRAELRDYAETSPSPVISSGTLTLDLEAGNVFEVILTENVTSLFVAHPPASGRAGSCSLILRQDATGANAGLAGFGQVGRWGAAADHERCRCGRRLCVDHEGWGWDLVQFSRRTGLQLMLGVASAALWAAGCTWRKPSATPLSRWEFDETSSAEGVFEDRGPAHVLMIHAGTWVDLTTNPLVAGDDGTSAYTDGSAYATIPADVPAYNLAAITISFYYQRESASDKHILLAGGDGSQAGDFSIEVQPDGRLRGWHTGQDGVLRRMDQADGITGTNLQVGTAYRIDLTLGPQGARIYLDGVELVAGAIPQNTNGWNNSRVKYLGRWTDGVLSPAHGVFDRLRIWNRQLSAAEIAALEPAQTITLPDEEPGEPPQPGDAPLRPSLAEWLVSDEAAPTATKFVSNQNRGNGSGSSPANAQEVQAALNGASRGQNFIAVCQTPGTIEHWNYPTGLDFPGTLSGTSYITLQARQGDGVVINMGGDFIGAATPNNGFWTQSGLSADDISKHIWRSTATFSGGEQDMYGWWIEFDQPHQLIEAGNMTNLRAPYGTANSPTSYAAPCIHKASDGRVYIRFQRPHLGKYSVDNKWSELTWPNNPEAVTNGQIVYPISQDPNNYEIYMAQSQTSHTAFDPGTSGHHIRIGAGINSCGFRHAFRGASNIQGGRGLHYTWQDFIEFTTGSTAKTHYYFNRTRMTDGCKIHASRAEWKFGGWKESNRSSFIRMSSSNTLSHYYFKDCTIGDFHELVVSGVDNVNHIRFRNCTFMHILDDGWQTRHNTSHTESGYCYFYNTAHGGPGTSGSEPAAADPGHNYFHHNVLDNRQERNTEWRAQPHPHFIAGVHSPNGPGWYKRYNNLMMWGPDNEEELGNGFMHCPSGSAALQTGAANMHEVFNNIIMRVFLEGTKRYDNVSSAGAANSSNSTNRSDFVNGRRWLRYGGASNEIFDYNCYWRPPEMNVDALLKDYCRTAGSVPEQNRADYTSLTAWRASSEFPFSKNSGSARGAYSPGFDGNSTDSKPALPAIDNPTVLADRFNYRPSPTAVVTVAKTGSLCGSDWWTTPPDWGDDYFPWNDGAMTLAPDAWKGALNPNGSTMPVGVQNP